MAASIITSPAGIISALDCVLFVGNLSDIGTAPIERKFGYKLINITDTQDITALRYIKPETITQEFPLDFAADMEGVVFTTPPPIGTIPSIVEDQTILKEVALEYYERVINTEDCTQIDNLIGTTNSFIVINSAPQFYDTILGTIEPLVLHKLPSTLYDCRNTERFIWVYGFASITMVFRKKTVHVLGQLLGSVTEDTTSDQVSIVHVGFARPNVPAGTQIIDITFSPAIHQPIRIYLNECCCEDDTVKDIYFQSRYGGYDVLSMDCLSAKSVLSEHQTYCLAIDCEDTRENRVISGQNLITNKKSSQKLIFTKDLTYDVNDSRWLDDLLMSRNYFIKDYDSNGDAYLARFIVQSSEAITYSEDNVTLQIVGEYSNRIKMPY